MIMLPTLRPLLQRAGARVASPVAAPATPLDLVLGSDWITQAVLLLLILLSVVSWAVTFVKWQAFRHAEAAARVVAREVEEARDVHDVGARIRRGRRTAFGAVLTRALRFLEETTPAMGGTTDRTARLSASQVEALRLVLDSESSREREALGRYIPWLATVGSVSPLIGLLGTVLGVISAFTGITQKGSGNIAAVAPGIAIALTATAAALTVAIPAAFAYNVFAARLNRFDNELEAFGSEIIALLARAGRL